MKNLSIVTHIAAVGAVAMSLLAAPVAAHAQRSRGLDQEIDRRQAKKNEWRNIALASGGVAVLGLLRKDRTLFFGGAAGALYGLHRYEQDRKSQSRLERARSQFFSNDHFYRDGQRYDRHTLERDGQRYYQFRRGDDRRDWRENGDRWRDEDRNWDRRGDDRWDRRDDNRWGRNDRNWDRRDDDRRRRDDDRKDRKRGRGNDRGRSKGHGKRG